jgi:hypothetical protein
MKQTKAIYKTPSCKIIEIGFNEGILQSSTTGTWDDSMERGTIWQDTEDDYGLE